MWDKGEAKGFDALKSLLDISSNWKQRGFAAILEEIRNNNKAIGIDMCNIFSWLSLRGGVSDSSHSSREAIDPGSWAQMGLKSFNIL